MQIMKEMQIGARFARNRIFLAPMGEGMANVDGTVSDQAIGYYTEYAKGGVAVITPGVVSVDFPTGKPEKLIFRADDQRFVRDWNRMAESIHRYGGMLIPQLHHAGAQTDIYMTDGATPVCVSDVDCDHQLIMGHRAVGPQKELTTDEIKELVRKFVAAARNCQLAGCDGVALHSAHGYLINQFLSPATNKRTDGYGGNLENQARFGCEIIRGIREVCGPNFVIGARIPGHEWLKDGLTDDECDEIARMYEAAGCDYFDVSGGLTSDSTNLMETSSYPEGARVQYAARIKKVVNIPVGAVGKLRHADFCEKLVEEGTVDFIVTGRSLICDPYLPNKIAQGAPETIRPCLSCFDGCTNRLFMGRAISCALNPRAGREYDLGRIDKAETPKKVVVIGGGPAGMEAAFTAASLGHDVTLFEKTDKLGGQFNLACVPPHKDAIAEACKWFIQETYRAGVKVELNTEATLEKIEAIAPDEILFAPGAEVVRSIPIPGVENTVVSWDILSGAAKVPENKNVTIIGGGIVGCEVAQMLIEKGNKVTILEMKPMIAEGLEAFHTLEIYQSFAINQVLVETKATVEKIDPDQVSYKVKVSEGTENSGADVLGQATVVTLQKEVEEKEVEKTVAADMIVLAVGQRSAGKDLRTELTEKGYHPVVIGDAKRPAKFIDAVTEGYFAAVNIR